MQDVMKNQSAHASIESDIQSINPSLQRWLHSWMFSGVKYIGTGLQRWRKEVIWSDESSSPWTDQYENVVPRSLQSVDLNSTKHLQEIFDQPVRQCSPPPSPKLQMSECVLEERCPVPPVEFQRPEESVPRCIEARRLARTRFVGSSSVTNL